MFIDSPCRYHAADTYADITAATHTQQLAQQAKPTIRSANPLDQHDPNSAEFRAGIAALCDQLQIAAHPDALMRLQACATFVEQRLSSGVLAEQQETADGATPTYQVREDGRCAFDDADVDQAAKILRLLQIDHLRELQTGINEAIVAVQELTADPKTDTKLGKVGVK